jgi:hypothetical protein
VAPDIDAACAATRKAVHQLHDDLAVLRPLAASDEVGRFLLDRVAVAAEHGAGCAMLAEARLASPGAVVARSLLEALFGTCWASIDDVNGRRLMEAGRRELLRIMRLNLQAGHASVRHRETGEDRTAEILRHPVVAEAERLPRFDHLAKDAGLKKIYDALYGLMSMFAHGAGGEFASGDKRDGFIHAQLHAAAAVVRCNQLIVANRFRHGRATTQDELAAILKVKL